jgi:hypothetical protein
VVTNVQGAVVFHGVHRPSGRKSMTLDITDMDLADGLYVVQVQNEAGSAARKLVVRR